MSPLGTRVGRSGIRAGFLIGVAFTVAAAVPFFALLEACTPAQRAAVPPVERALCVVLRAASPDLDEVCATADELAPLVPGLLEARAGVAPQGLVVAFKMPAPHAVARPSARRRCASWLVLEAGAGGLEAGALEAGP